VRERKGRAGKSQLAWTISGGGKRRADAKLMQKPAKVRKSPCLLERVKGIEASAHNPQVAEAPEHPGRCPTFG
jgi:hypothetical protein